MLYKLDFRELISVFWRLKSYHQRSIQQKNRSHDSGYVRQTSYFNTPVTGSKPNLITIAPCLFKSVQMSALVALFTTVIITQVVCGLSAAAVLVD